MNKIATFFSEVKKEASKVTWPTRQETMLTSTMVVVMSLVMGVFFLVVDGILAHASRFLINIRL
jgi:preprotein translocase subunit SecE